MTLARYLLGIPLALLTVGPLAYGASGLRRRFVPDARGCDGLLVDIVLVLSAVTLIGQALGTVGWFRLVPIVTVSAVSGAATGWWFRSRSLEPDPRTREATVVTDAVDLDDDDEVVPGAPRAALIARVAAGAGVGLVFASWLARTFDSLRGGSESADTLWYHMPSALRFVQTGRTTGVPILDGDPTTAFYPVTSSLWHADGLLLFRTDLPAVVSSLGWFVLAMLAAWCIGRRFDAGPAALLGTAMVLGMPVLVETQAGAMLSDVVGIALLLVAVALALPRAGDPLSPGRVVVIGLALGLTTGMKFSFLFPAGAAAIGVAFLAGHRRRLVSLAMVTVAAAVTGGYWYVRNAHATGNPLPSLDLDLKVVHLAGIPGTIPLQTPVTVMGQPGAWDEYLFLGLREALGPAWVAVLVVCLVGISIGLIRPAEARLRVVAVVALATIAVFLATPQYVLGGALWASTLRYALPGILLGLILGPIALRRHPRRDLVITLVLAFLVALTQFDHAVWTIGDDAGSFFFPVARRDAWWSAVVTLLAAGPVVAGSHWALARRRAGRLPVWVAGTSVALVALVALAAVHAPYLDRRYRQARPFPAAFAWAQDLSGTDIGVTGQLLVLKYPFAGADLSNRVRYVAVRQADGAVRPPASCREWRRLLAAGRYDYVAVNDAAGNGTLRWTTSIPGAVPVVEEGAGRFVITVFRLPSTIDHRGC